MVTRIVRVERPLESLAALYHDERLHTFASRRAGLDQWAGSCFWGRLVRLDNVLGVWFVNIGLDREGVVPARLIDYFCRDRKAKATEGLYVPLEVTAEAREGKGLRLKPVLSTRNLPVHGKAKPHCFLDLRDPVDRLVHFEGLENKDVDTADPGLHADLSSAWRDCIEPETGFGSGSLVIEPCSALTAIDVNVRGQALAGNLDACAPVAREIIRRNISGQILVDFASLDTKAERNHVLDTLKAAFAIDTRKLSWGGIDGFSCLLFTRQRLGNAAHEVQMQSALAPETGWRVSPQTGFINALDKLYMDHENETDWAKVKTGHIKVPEGISPEMLEAARKFMIDVAFIKLEPSHD